MLLIAKHILLTVEYAIKNQTYHYSGTPRIGALPSKRTAPRYEGVPRYAGF